tara:strand:- start:4198 stop:4428 length:231 start_codon:yes stop_codon:yes gene_type:complete
MTAKITFSPFLPIAISIFAILGYVTKLQLWLSTPTQGTPSFSTTTHNNSLYEHPALIIGKESELGTRVSSSRFFNY